MRLGQNYFATKLDMSLAPRMKGLLALSFAGALSFVLFAPVAWGQVSISLGEPRQVFHAHKPDALGLFNVPDMHTAMLRQADGSYLLWITGDITGSTGDIAVARLETRDFVTYRNAGDGESRHATPVLAPSCRGAERPACRDDPDSDYVGANAVLPASNGRDLLMLYEAGTKWAGDTYIAHGWEYNVLALARSSDGGRSWTRQGAVLSGSDPKPAHRTRASQPGISEPGALVADGYVYVFYQYVPNDPATADDASIIQAARAPVSSDGAAGAWMKYRDGSFSQPGLGGTGSAILSTGGNSGCTRPVQVWPAYSEYLRSYVLTFLCNEGWFFSISKDLTTWAPPSRFLSMPMWQRCGPMDWNFVLVTPGQPAGVLGRTGYVLYAHSDQRGLQCPGGFKPHMLWIRPFTFSGGP